MRSFLFAVILSLVCTVGATPLVAAPVSLVEVSGVIEVCRAGAVEWVTCGSGATINVGDRVRCSKDGAASLQYADGTRLKIKGATAIQMLSSGYRLRYGNSWVRVVKQGTRFRTMTPNAVVSVRGTIYSVTARPTETLAGREFERATASDVFRNALPRAHLAGGSLLLALLQRETVTTDVKVFRGCVAVETAAGSSSAKAEYVLEAGHALAVDGVRQVADHRLLDVDDYKEWGIEFRRHFMPDLGESTSTNGSTPRRSVVRDDGDVEKEASGHIRLLEGGR